MKKNRVAVGAARVVVCERGHRVFSGCCSSCQRARQELWREQVAACARIREAAQ